jgi:2-dehydro-3-deoxyphosphooctonate aldolase (KDO 8-P synthase)
MPDPLRRDDCPLFIFAGPCAIESYDLCMMVGEQVKAICDDLGLAYVFKGSFDKANRTSGSSPRGPGMEAGLKVLEKVGAALGVPTMTDVHESPQAAAVGQVCDVLQVPAFLARQTDLLHACGKTGKTIHVKKGQFMAPSEMANPVAKLADVGCDDVVLCERGTFFGYGRLVNDMTALREMRRLGKPVSFDATHSTQRPAGQGDKSGGDPTATPLLARAAVAAGVDGLFIECHPEPSEALSDAASMVRLDGMRKLLTDCTRIEALGLGD